MLSKADLTYYLFRFLIFSFFFTLIVMFFYFLGTAQGFLDTSLLSLHNAAKVLTWSGFILALVVLFLRWQTVSRFQKFLLGFFAFCFFLGFLIMTFFGVWLYPGALS